MKDVTEPVDGLSWNLGKLSAIIYEVRNGSKPVAELMVPMADLQSCEQILDDSGLCYKIDHMDNVYVKVYLYKHRYLEEVIMYLCQPSRENDTVQHWMWGKLFGYSEQCIAEFIERHCQGKIGAQ